jgi:hypothetical protein
MRVVNSRRSLPSESKLLLKRVACAGGSEVGRIPNKWKTRFNGRKFPRSAEMIRRDRER